MTRAEERLQRHLQMLAEASASYRNEALHSSVCEFIWQRGQFWTPAPLPGVIGRGLPQFCFANARLLALGRPDLRYCEGYAIGAGGSAHYHAWTVDDDGRVVDNTPIWCEAGTAYYGVIFADDEIIGRPVPVIDDWKNGWPLLRRETTAAP